MNCDYQSILAAARCFECIPEGIQSGVQTKLLQSISGTSMNDEQLMNAARCIATCIPPGMLNEVKTRLLCEVVDNRAPPTPPAPEPCTNPLVDDPVTGWAARVVANGGAEPFPEVRQAMCVFADGLDSAGLTGKMIAVNCVVPYDLIASITPLIVGPGNDPWTNSGPFVDADLTNNGLQADGVSKYLKTGVNPDTAFSNNTSAGLTIYNMTSANLGRVEMGAISGGTNIIQLINSYNDAPKNCFFDCYGFANRLIVPNPLWVGYLSANRTAVNAASVYKASDTVPFQTLGSIAAGGGTRPNIEIYAYAINSAGVASSFSSRRLSFMAIHVGLTSPESQQLYNLVRALRGSLLGGFI